MRVNARFSLVALLVGVIVAASAPAAAQAAGFGIEKFFSATCNSSHPECAQEGTVPGYTEPEPEENTTVAESEVEGYPQAAGRVPYGITDFQVSSEGEYPKKKPLGVLTHLRTDVAPGFSTAPAAVPECSEEELGRPIPGGFFGPPGPECLGSVIGVQFATVFNPMTGLDLALKGNVYNLVQKQGQASLFGVAVEVAPGVFAHTLIEGGVEYGKEASGAQQGNGTGQGDYHDWFEVTISPTLPIVRSRLAFNGRSGNGAFLTNATECPGHTVTTLTVEDLQEEEELAKNGTPPKFPRFTYLPKLPLDNCNHVPFEPKFSVNPATAAPDQPDGATTEVQLPHNPKAEIDNSDVKAGSVTFPQGMTLNTSAAHELGTCSPAQFPLHLAALGNSCPASSKVATVTLETPNLPPGSLTGNAYLADPAGGPITGPPFTVYVEANSARYNVSVRVQGTVTPDPVTGRVTATFNENPEQPLGNLILHLKGGALATFANPLACGAATSNGSFTGFSEALTQSPPSSFGVACAGTPPFSLGQSTASTSTTGGAATSFTFNIGRADGQQFLSQVKTALPEGLTGLIPSVTECAEAQANAGTCPAASQIGVVGVEAGAGPSPYLFNGNVYLTGPYQGAPFGLSIVVPTLAGPFNFGNVITRASISINPYTTQVTTTSTLPTIVKGIPIRLKHISVAINKPGFLLNPTNCDVQHEESTFGGIINAGLPISATQSLSTPFQVTGCNGLAFKPKFKARTAAKYSKINGASFETTLDLAKGSANVKSIMVQLPKDLPSRLTTLQKACPEAVFNANPLACEQYLKPGDKPSDRGGSVIGHARASTPTLPGKLKGPAILVSHGGEAFPDLVLVLEDDGVRVIVVGHTKITNGITTTNFASTPDAPVTSITLNLPTGPHSAVTALSSLCIKPLRLPTLITGQNGIVDKLEPKIIVGGCPVRILSRKVHRNKIYLVVQTYATGTISVTGRGVVKNKRHLKAPNKHLRLTIRLKGHGHHKKGATVKLRVTFKAKQKSAGNSAATTRVKLK